MSYQIVTPGQTRIVTSPQDIDMMFRAIQQLTGLDRSVAEAILETDVIEHPGVEIRRAVLGRGLEPAREER